MTYKHHIEAFQDIIRYESGLSLECRMYIKFLNEMPIDQANNEIGIILQFLSLKTKDIEKLSQ